jgi:hypothetical protein
MNISEEIKQEWPKAWMYFLDYYEKDFKEKQAHISFEELAFEYQLGVFLSFFNQINMDFQFFSSETEALKESVKESFETYNEYLFLDS